MPDLLLLICKSVYMKTLFNHSFEGKLSMMGLNLVLPAVLFAHLLGTWYAAFLFSLVLMLLTQLDEENL